MPAITSPALRPTYRGTWASGQAYRINDVVYYNGSSYLAVSGSTGKTPSSEPTYWGPLSSSTTALDSAAQITWGTDPLTNFYRYAPGLLKSDGNVAVGGNLYAFHNNVAQSALGAVGPGGQLGVQLYDTKLYRDDVNRLRTDNDFLVAGDFKLLKGGVYGSDAETQAAATIGYVKSRAGGLVTNGNGGLRNNYNFSSFTFDSGDTHGGGGSFLINAAQTGVFSDERIPVDPGDGYTLSFWAKSGDTNPTTGAVTNYNPNNVQYVGFAPYDADGLIMEAIHRIKVFGSANTTLTAALNPGDTTVKIADATGWSNGSDSGFRHFNWWPYTGSNGEKYPVYGYSRNTTLYNGVANAYTNGTWAQNGISGTTITLTAPWSGPALPSGTPVQNTQTGGTYLYTAIGGTAIPSTWTRYSAQLLGSNTTKLSDVDSFMLPVGCASVRLLFLVNYQGAADNKVRYSGIDMVETAGDGGRVAKITSDTYLPQPASFGTGDARTFLLDATSGTRTVTLGAPGKLGLGPLRWTFAKTDASANSVVINAAGGGALIDGANTVALTRQGETRTIVHDGTNWISVSAYRPASIDTITAGTNTSTQGLFNANSASGPAGMFLKDTGVDRWAVYMTGSNSPLYVRDMANSRMQATFTPGSSSTTASTSFNSNVVVNGTAQLNGDLAVAGGSQVNSLNATNGVQAGSSTAGAGIFTVDSNNGTAGLFYRDGGATKWAMATLGTNQPLLIIDSVNNRGQITLTAGASDTTAVTTFNSNTQVKGNETVTGTLTVTGGITGVNNTNGAPTGGTTGQVLAKKSATNYDTQWVTASSGLTPVTQTVATTGAPGNLYLVDATNGSQYLTLPSSPVSGSIIALQRIDSSANTWQVSGSINGVSSNIYIFSGQRISFTYDGTTWRPTFSRPTLQDPGSVFVPGNWYDPRVSSTASVTTSPCTNGTIYYLPMFLSRPVKISSVCAYVATAAASGTVRVGAYTMEPILGTPKQLIVDGGAVSAATTGFRTAAVSATLPAGWVYLAVVPQGSDVTLQIASASQLPTVLGSGAAAGSTTPGAQTSMLGYSSTAAALTSGAFNAAASTSGLVANYGGVPLPWFQAAS